MSVYTEASFHKVAFIVTSEVASAAASSLAALSASVRPFGPFIRI